VPAGYFVARSRTYGVWFPGRGFKVNGDPKPAVEAIKRTLRIYPLAQASNSPPTNFINVSGIANNRIHANNLSTTVNEHAFENVGPFSFLVPVEFPNDAGTEPHVPPAIDMAAGSSRIVTSRAHPPSRSLL
jgi:hypothetical protein